MDTEKQIETASQDVEEQVPKDTSFFTPKDAREVVGKVVSTNFAVLMAGLNGVFSATGL